MSCYDVLMKTEGLIWRSMNNNEVFCNFVTRPEDENSTISAINRPKFVEMKHYTQNLGTQDHNISSYDFLMKPEGPTCRSTNYKAEFRKK